MLETYRQGAKHLCLQLLALHNTTRQNTHTNTDTKILLILI